MNRPSPLREGYCSKKNSACLLERGLIDGIMLKAQKGMKLTERQRELNNCISKMRRLIERTFGSIILIPFMPIYYIQLLCLLYH